MKAQAGFQSNINRSDTLFVIADNPPPDAYDPVLDPKYIINARPQDNFGSDSKRESLF